MKAYAIKARLIKASVIIAILLSAGSRAESVEPVQTQVYFGDTHLHSNYSFDAFFK